MASEALSSAELPPPWLARPAGVGPGRGVVAGFDRLLAGLGRPGPGGAVPVIEYRLAAPKWRFLCHAVDVGGLLLHGSGDPDIRVLEPRQPEDDSELGSRPGVYAAADGIWPMFFATVDRERHRFLMSSMGARPGDLGPPAPAFYYFSLTAEVLARRPWRAGSVYLLPPDGFELQAPMVARGVRVRPAQAVCPRPVRPVARIAVEPADFPFLGQVLPHDDEELLAMAAAEPLGFPWLGH
ncbi:hypothetical protein FH609_020115 [Streptomyces sp. 3MP-14]|uniref:Uncharacterized protein n=1 Tax=Streptomyces mimosae TaxID=2586635 RepID=A0A5N6A1S0_9ACTN|nr:MULTISPECIES: hypothetical protein [Streptomyces]KAB8161836.1 hypothetical protein FH607_024305 [Streptomyces mimosae]KAB8174896.1 hypothetical protein FH609_020115 [Streptomyces sp. 3MP-14]